MNHNVHTFRRLNPVKNWIRLSLLLVLLVAHATRAWAEVRLAGIFTDHMVLQRDRPIQVWGWAAKGEAITVEFAEHAAKTTAGEDGSWSVTLKPLAASAGGRELRVQGAGQRIAVRDVVVGEVWHASGQSNMAMTAGSMARELEPVKSDIAAADLPPIRFCRVNEAESSQPLDDLRAKARWTPCSPTTVAGFSGVAFYFARQRGRAEVNWEISTCTACSVCLCCRLWCVTGGRETSHLILGRAYDCALGYLVLLGFVA
jgi:sialate O-acetylesterase